MPIIIPPPPTRADQGDRVWTDWYVKLTAILSSTNGIAWALVDKTGSALSDLATRSHSMLTGIAGTGVNHISVAENSLVTNLLASGHAALSAILGTGSYHISSAEASDVTNLNSTARLQIHTSTIDPTTSDVVASNWIIWKNTTANEIRLWVNDSGTMKKSAALT